jgi:hypothetical protein
MTKSRTGLARKRLLDRFRLCAALTSALTACLIAGLPDTAHAQRQARVELGNAVNYAVLGGNAVHSVADTMIIGNVGVFPGDTLTGFPPGEVRGMTFAGSDRAAQAKQHALAAFEDVDTRLGDTVIPPQLGGTTRTPGVYDSSTGDFVITGTLTLDAQGDPDAVFIFRASALTTSRVSNIDLVRGAQENNVFWHLDDSAALGTLSTFRGNILARNSVHVDRGTAFYGRAFAFDDTVTLVGTVEGPATRVSIPSSPPTSTTLTQSTDRTRSGQPVTFTARVRTDAEPIVPAGEVVFLDGDTIIGSAYHDADEPARFTTTALRVGRHEITAVYLGGYTSVFEAWVRFAPSRSETLVHVVTP